MRFRITQAERDSGAIDTAKLAAIIQNIREVGFAVVDELISPESCRILTESILEDVEQIRATGQPTLHEQNTGAGHLQLGLRRYSPYVCEDLVANPLIECVVAGLLGRGAWLGFYNGNVNCPGSGYQPLHFDRPFSWKSPDDAARDGQAWPPPTTTLSCSIALDEITEANGATEIYPGSHLETEVIQFSNHRLTNHPELIAKWEPSARMAIPARGVCFRDPRMWHRGVPNPAGVARAMIAVTYHAERCKHWGGKYMQELPAEIAVKCAENDALRVLDDGNVGDGRLVFQSDVRDIFEKAPNLHGINRNVRFVELPRRVNHFEDAHMRGGARIVESAQIVPEGM